MREIARAVPSLFLALLLFAPVSLGAKTLLPKMWPLANELLDGAFKASLGEIAEAISLLAERNRIVAEGAGACPVAVALSGMAGSGKIVCVVSGGNIDSSKLSKILSGETPRIGY